MSSMECIIDANGFVINDKDIVHHPRPTDSRGVRIVGLCGVYAFTDFFGTYPEDFKGQDFSTRAASWADVGGDGRVACPSCLEANPHWF